MFRRLCELPPIPLGFSLATVVPRRALFNLPIDGVDYWGIKSRLLPTLPRLNVSYNLRGALRTVFVLSVSKNCTSTHPIQPLLSYAQGLAACFLRQQVNTPSTRPAQSFWITLAPTVLPRLLARSFAGTLTEFYRNPSSLTCCSSIKLALIVEVYPLLTQKSVWTVSQFHRGRSVSQRG